MRKFCTEARKRNGELYTKASLVGIRFGLQQLFSSHKIDFIKDPEFSEANAVYQAEISELKREGKAHTPHKPPINKDDTKKLYESGLFSLILGHSKTKFFVFLKSCLSSVEEDART